MLLTGNFALHIWLRSLLDGCPLILSNVREYLHDRSSIDPYFLKQSKARREQIAFAVHVVFVETAKHRAEGDAIFDGLCTRLALI